MFEGRYQKFVETVNPLVGVRGKRMNINDLKYSVEEIYSIRFMNDRNNLGENPENFPFPNFVYEFFTNKYVKKPAVDQHSLDLLLSVDYFKNKDIIISIFSKFLNEELDSNDLEFYLYVRSCIEKELKMLFMEFARQQTKKPYGIANSDEKEKLLLNVKSCVNLANNIYGEEQEELLNGFMNKIEDILAQQKNLGPKKNLISADKILYITLNDYHENKFTNNNANNNISNINNSTTSNTKNIKNLSSGGSTTYENIQKNYGMSGGNIEDKINRIKMIICSYIKEKELDVFFDKLLTSYMVYEKSKNNIEEIMDSIKSLVFKKVNLLINILFNGDEKGWYNSLKLEEGDEVAKTFFINLTQMITEMLQFERTQDIPESMVETFGQTLLTTPELNNQIIKLVTKRFE